MIIGKASFPSLLKNVWIDIKDVYKYWYNDISNINDNKVFWVWIFNSFVITTILYILCKSNIFFNFENTFANNDIVDKILVTLLFYLIIGWVIIPIISALCIWIISLITNYVSHYQTKFSQHNNITYNSSKFVYPKETIIKIDGIEYELGDEVQYYRDSYGDEYITLHGKFREIIQIDKKTTHYGWTD